MTTEIRPTDSFSQHPTSPSPQQGCKGLAHLFKELTVSPQTSASSPRMLILRRNSSDQKIHECAQYLGYHDDKKETEKR
ncbi:MAG: hypothetical protein KGJ02_06295 [Verrucomicrobiota bacterium]|nr:hypothetical protein [Verrucomicrobiota bacterium]